MGATAHLGIKFGEYDATIASLIPHYKELIDAAAAAVGAVAPTAPAVVDLGTGSGALAAAIVKVRPKARLIGIDADEAMLAAAKRRLRGRIDTIRGNFELRPHPALRRGRGLVRAASHRYRPQEGGALQAMLHRLRDGGMMVSADCFLASSATLQQAPSRGVARALAEEIHAEESGELPAHVGEGGRLLHARSRA